ncbi:MAG: hypothetical protein ACR2IF_08525 [Terriglobales bacterium]
MATGLKRAAAWLVIAVAAIYAGDYVVMRLRTEPTGSVMVRKYYALHKAREKTNFVFAEPAPETCVHALFPHLGYPPCWWLSRHTEQRIDYE